MKTTALDLTRLGSVLDLEVALMRDFLILLEREERLLVEGEADALIVLADEKTAVYRKLQRLHDQRSLLLGASGRGNTGDAVRTAVAQSPVLSQRWEEILTLARQAQERNALNGRMIAEKLQHNQAALNILMAASDRPQFYGPDGQSRPSGSGRILGSA